MELADRLPTAGLARPLLTAAALLDSNGIPAVVFTTNAVRVHLADPGEGGASDRTDAALSQVVSEDVEDALSNLHRLSLITLNRDEDGAGAGSVRVHALVQRATREQAGSTTRDLAACAAAGALLEAWPDRDYRPEHALVAQSLRRSERALADYERVLGPDHLTTLSSRARLASAYQDAGRQEEAVALFEQLLVEVERLLGPDHPEALAGRATLGAAYQDAGRLAEALPLYEQVVADTERELGSAHPQLAVALYRLAQAQVEPGDLASAAVALGRAVEVDTAAYGPDHPEVATDLEALAAVQEQQGNTEDAAESRARAQRIREQHPSAGSFGE